MAELLTHQTEWLEPLRSYYAAAGAALPVITVIEGREVPRPYHELLVHRQDMTSVLERYHRSAIGLRLLQARVESGIFIRQVVLVSTSAGRAVEFGAIHIHLDRFDMRSRLAILECRRPLGGILRDHGIGYVSRPAAYLRVRSDAIINAPLGLVGEHDLFGRHNRLYDSAGRPLAEVIEILPPIGISHSGTERT